MTKMYWEADANADALKGKTIAVLGYGSQGRAHAMNLRDSGCDVVLGLRKDGKTWKQAQEEDGWTPKEPKAAVLPLTLSLSDSGYGSTGFVQRIRCTEFERWWHGLVCARIQHPLQTNSTKSKFGYRHDCAKGSGGLVRRTYKKATACRVCLLCIKMPVVRLSIQLSLMLMH